MRDEAIWTFTATNSTLFHAFRDGRALCNKGIKPRTAPDADSTGPYVAHCITLEDVRNWPYSTACDKCQVKAEQPIEAAKPTVVAEEQAMKDEKLSTVMVEAITLIGGHATHRVRTGTIVALITRGIVTTVGGRHLLTDKGVKLFRELNGHKPSPSATEVYVAANTVIYEVGDIVTTIPDNDDARGVVTSALTGQGGQLVGVAWDGDSVSYMIGATQLRKVKPETTVDLTHVDADDIVIEPSDLPATGLRDLEVILCSECKGPLLSDGWNCSRRAEHAPPVERRLTGRPLVDFGAAQMWSALTEAADHQKDRDRLAKSIAYEFSHVFLKWGVGEPTPEKPVVPRELDRPRMLEFYRNGAIWDAGWLLTEIRNAMDSIIGSIDVTDRVNRMDAVNAMTWLGWLHAYVLECGKPGDDGWHNRRREPQDGWEDLGLYSTEPSDAEELPAWADAEDEQSFGCVAVIAPQGRWDDSEACGDYVTREEYYAHGPESAMCPRHRLAAELINEQPY